MSQWAMWYLKGNRNNWCKTFGTVYDFMDRIVDDASDEYHIYATSYMADVDIHSLEPHFYISHSSCHCASLGISVCLTEPKYCIEDSWQSEFDAVALHQFINIMKLPARRRTLRVEDVVYRIRNNWEYLLIMWNKYVTPESRVEVVTDSVGNIVSPQMPQYEKLLDVSRLATPIDVHTAVEENRRRQAKFLSYFDRQLTCTPN